LCRQEAIFDQYDQAGQGSIGVIFADRRVKEMLLAISADAWKDKDGVLTAGEIVAYVKGEHQFDLAEEAGAKAREIEGVSEVNDAAS
jgi:hypothetical protein